MQIPPSWQKNINCPSGIEVSVNGVSDRPRSIQHLSDNLLHSGVQLLAYKSTRINPKTHRSHKLKEIWGKRPPPIRTPEVNLPILYRTDWHLPLFVYRRWLPLSSFRNNRALILQGIYGRNKQYRKFAPVILEKSEFWRCLLSEEYIIGLFTEFGRSQTIPNIRYIIFNLEK